MRHYGDLERVHLLEVSEELAQRHLAVDLDAVPLRKGRLVELGIIWRHGLAKCEERHGQIYKTIFVHVDVSVALNQLVHLDAVETDNERRGRCNRRYDAAGDQFALVAIGGRDVVVLGAEVRARHDEVHVHVGVVVFFELDGHDNNGGGSSGYRAQLRSNRIELTLFEVGRVLGGARLLRVVRVDLDALLGLEIRHLDASHHLDDALPVATLSQAVHLGLEVGRREHEVKAGGVFARERERVRTTFGARPEGHTIARHLIGRKVVEQLLDVVVVVLLPEEASRAHALFERSRLIADECLIHRHQLLERLRPVQLHHSSDIRLRVLEEVTRCVGRVREQSFELFKSITFVFF